MMTIEERVLLIEIQDQLIELYVERGEAKAADEPGRVCELQIDINELEAQRSEFRRLDSAET